jgi:uncharacterized repeat protein (TIGR01451 family)
VTTSSSFIARTAIFCLALVPTTAFADLVSDMTAYVVTTDEDGVESYFQATSVKPGQLIEYRLAHTNTFPEAIGGVAVTGPVPTGGILVPDWSYTDVPATFEVRGEFDPDSEGEEWSTLPAERIVILEDGTRTVEPALPEHFTAVRWRLSDAMQQDASVHQGYRIRVE